MALAELRGGVPVQLQGHRQRRLGVRSQRAVARGRRRGLGDAAHPDRVVVAAGEQCLPGGSAQRSGVEPVVLQAAGGQPLGSRGAARTAERTRCPEPHVVQQHDQHVRGALGRQQRLDRRVRRVRVLRVVGRQARSRSVWNRQHAAGVPVWAHGRPSVRGSRSVPAT